MAVTGLQIITRALKALAVLESSEVPGPNEAQDALTSLNDLLETWGLTLQGVPAVSRLVLPLVASQSIYTIGPSGDVDTVRPDHIEAVSLVQDRTATTVSELPLEPPLTVAEWQHVPLKAVTSDYPTRVFYNRNVNASGQSTLSVYPIPTGSLADLILYAAVPLSAFDLSSSVALPSGWARALVANLALELAPSYGAAIHSALRDTAEESKTALFRANHETPILQLSQALPGMRGRGGFDIFAGR